MQTTGTLQPLTGRQVMDYPLPISVGPITGARIAAEYNKAWAGRTWTIVDGTIIYGESK